MSRVGELARVPWESGRGNRGPRKADVKIAHLRRFVVLSEELHFPRAAIALNIPLASLYTTIDKLEEEVGRPIVTREGETQLTATGKLLLIEAHERIAEAPPVVKNVPVPAGGKAKASKGIGRTPSVKGQPKPFKKRQGR